MKDDKQGDDSPMERFENLAKRLFSIAKKDAEKVEETVEEFADEIVKPEEPSAE